MSFRRVKAVLLACSGMGVLLAATVDANAGGFALREQSSWGQGSSFAGVAAGGDLSAMFWNPATMTQVPGIQSESVLSGIMPYAANTVGAPSTFGGAPFFFGGTGDTGNDAIVPAGYFSYQLNPQLWVGMSVNSPFGLSVSFPDTWAGRAYSGDTSLKTYNFAPSVAYQLNNWISVGVGLQVQYGKADFATGLPVNGFGAPPGLTNQLSLSGSGWAYGFTAGVTLTPTPTTTIGIGYRSALNQKIDGTVTLPPGPLYGAPFSTPGAASTSINLPAIASIGLRQGIGPQWTLLGTVEWTQWSRIGTPVVTQPNGAPVLVLNGVGGGALTLPFEYRDGWFFSLGAEYQWNPQLAVRGGIGFEKSPITDQVRTPRLPDNDRTWLSLGATYKWTKKLSFDFAYSHLFVKSTAINVIAGNPSFIPAIGTYTGTVDAHVDIVSVALKYRWDDPAPEPVKQGYFKAK